MSVSSTVDKSGDRVREMFLQISPRYDLMNHLLSLNVDRYWRRRTVQLVPPSGADPILDVCTGTGDLAIAYYRAAGGKSTSRDATSALKCCSTHMPSKASATAPAA